MNLNFLSSETQKSLFSDLEKIIDTEIGEIPIRVFLGDDQLEEYEEYTIERDGGEIWIKLDGLRIHQTSPMSMRND